MRFDLEAINEIVFPDHFQSRQFDVLRLRLLGYTADQIANELGICPCTVYGRMQEIRQILGIFPNGHKGHRELMAWAVENGIVEVRL